MKTEHLLDQILSILSQARDDREKLQKILDFMEREIYEEQDDTVMIPEKYKDTVQKIAENIDCGLVCYLNPDTLELEDLPNNLDDPEEYELTVGESYDEMFKHDQWNKCIVVEPPESSQGFKIMERFVDEVDDPRLRDQLINALNRKRPFANFKNLVETSSFRQAWFDFKQKQLEMLVWDELQVQLGETE
ncbi:MAG: UPF0158 family protein [Marinilabiliaceae bacterium]